MPARTQNKINPPRTIADVMLNGLVRQNPILVGGMVIAPAVVFATTFEKALTLVIAFSMITFYTLLISSFVSQNILYTVRIILYTLIGALVYVPSIIILNSIMPDKIESMGVFFPLMITNSLIVSRSETTFFLERKSRMLIDVVFSIIGYDLAVLIFGFIREIISTGELNGNILAVPIVFSGFSKTFGGFLLLGIMAAIFRGVYFMFRKA